MRFEAQIIDSIWERMAQDGDDALTDPERFYRAIRVLEAEVANGSFHQFFLNSDSRIVKDALEGRKAVGAHRMNQLLAEAAAILGHSSALSDPSELLNRLSTEDLAQIDILSDRFSDYPDDLRALLGGRAKRCGFPHGIRS